MNKIKAFRLKYGLTKTELARRLGYSYEAIRLLEKGERAITTHFEKSLENLETILDSAKPVS